MYNIEDIDEVYDNEDYIKNNKELDIDDENNKIDNDLVCKSFAMDNNMHNNQKDDINKNISEIINNEEDDIKRNNNENDILVSSKYLNNSDLSQEEENNENEDGNDNIDNNHLNTYNNILFELYEEITNNIEKLNIENQDYKSNKNLRERVKNNKIIKNNNIEEKK